MIELLLNKELNEIFGINYNKNITTDVVLNESGYTVIAELPGYLKENINIDFKENILTIVANEGNKNEKDKMLLNERYLGKRSKSIYLNDVDKDSIKAKFDNGLLIIELKKFLPTIKKITIE